MSAPSVITANGIEFSYLEAGERDAPLVLCLHGFPDDAYTFDELLPKLARAGYRAVAPFTRGYYPSAIPKASRFLFAKGSGDYSTETLAKDALALIDALGATKAVILGHDWGAITGYAAANLMGDKVTKLIALAIPHPRALRHSYEQYRRSSQFVQLPWGRLSERLVAKDDLKYIDAIYRRWSPDWNVPGEQIRRIKDSFRFPGRLEAALGYYRSFVKDMFNRRKLDLYRSRTPVPTLTLYGEDDGAVLTRRFRETSTAFTGFYRVVGYPGAGHFIHRERPDEVSREIIEFLNGNTVKTGAPGPC